MSTNCLVTKLKSVVNNDNLMGLGELKIKRVAVGSSDGNKFIAASLSNEPGNKVSLHIVGNGNFLTAKNGTIIGKDLELEYGIRTDVFTSDGDYDIIVKNKYNFKPNAFEAGYHVEIADLFYTRCAFIDGLGFYGNISDANPENIINVTLPNGSSIKAPLKDFGKLHNLIMLSAPSCITGGELKDAGSLILLSNPNCSLGLEITGSIEAFVVAQRAARVAAGLDAGNSTGIIFRYLGAGGKISFDGSYITNTAINKITWTTTTITLGQGSNINNLTETTITA